MKRFNVLRSLVVLFLFSLIELGLAPSAAFGAVPQLLNFQGVLKDGSGNPVVGSNNVTFTIYTAPSGGMVLWAETTSVTTNAQGLFSVLLGADNPVPDSIFNDTARYLGIKVGADPEMTPRQELVSVAYAFRVAHFIPNFGTNNTFIGQNAGNLTMSGFGNNTANGTSALRDNTTGHSNTASGAFALRSNTTGGSNTASGRNALLNNTTGGGNTASGDGALGSNTSGGSNTASGSSALNANTIGVNNTASGQAALFSNTTGFQNTASGVNALVSNTTGSNNTAIGVAADVSLGNLTNATAIGAGATVNASNKIRLGNSAVTLVETDGNFKVGADDTVFTSNLSSNSPLNFQAPAGTTRMHIDDATGKVGIGLTNPLQTLTIGSNGAWTSTGLFPGILMGTTAFETKQILIGRDENNFVQLAYNDEDPATIARLNVEGNHPLYITTGGSLVLGTTANNPLELQTNSTVRMHIAGDGNIGIGTASPAYPLHVQKSSANIFAASIENQDPNGWGLEIRTAGTSAPENALEIFTGGTSRFLVRNDGNVGIGTTSVGASNLLELASTTKGLVLSRMTKAQRDAIVAPVAGMMVYQTDNTPGLRVYNGTNWMRFTETAD